MAEPQVNPRAYEQYFESMPGPHRAVWCLACTRATLGYWRRSWEPVVSAVDTSITVPAGTFRCLRYDLVDLPTPGPIIYWSVFVSPQVGIVQRIVNQTSRDDGKGTWYLAEIVFTG